MAHLTSEQIEEFKQICKKAGIEYASNSEATDAANRLVRLVDTLAKLEYRDRQRKERLKNEPKGFAIESNGGTCPLCYQSVYGQMWYDKYGAKCLDCRDALVKKIIPGYVFRDSRYEKHVTDSHLKWKYGIKRATLTKLMRNGQIRGRVVPSQIHQDVLVFLRSENECLAEVLRPYIVQQA